MNKGKLSLTDIDKVLCELCNRCDWKDWEYYKTSCAALKETKDKALNMILGDIDRIVDGWLTEMLPVVFSDQFGTKVIENPLSTYLRQQLQIEPPKSKE